jgi:hypothetical protein
MPDGRRIISHLVAASVSDEAIVSSDPIGQNNRLVSQGPLDEMVLVIGSAKHALLGQRSQKPRLWSRISRYYYLFYLRDRQHAKHPVNLPSNVRFKAEIIDTWEMTVTPLPGEFTGKCEIELPTKPYLPIRLTKIP